MKSNNQNPDNFFKTLLHIMFIIMLLNVPGCFDSSTEEAPPSVGTSTGGGSSGGKPLPSVVNDTLSVPPDTAGIVNVLDNDTAVGTGTLTVASFDGTSTNNGTVTDNGDGTLTYTPAAGYEGDDTFTYTVDDSSGTSGTGTVLVTVSQSVIPNGQAFYAANCAICHSAGTDDITSAFLASDLALRANPIGRDLSMYGGQYQLMGAYNALAQQNVDELKAYIASIAP
ncbi:Ig-like domain-containing protein [Kaarinaea lacus]